MTLFYTSFFLSFPPQWFSPLLILHQINSFTIAFCLISLRTRHTRCPRTDQPSRTWHTRCPRPNKPQELDAHGVQELCKCTQHHSVSRGFTFMIRFPILYFFLLLPFFISTPSILWSTRWPDPQPSMEQSFCNTGRRRSPCPAMQGNDQPSHWNAGHARTKEKE